MLSPGQRFARYVVEAAIGEGGMGEVYRAYDEKLRRKVALKVLHPDLAIPDAAARLVREARAAASLAHPNTIAIYDLGEIDDTVFVVMELVSGAPLRAFIGDPTVTIPKKLRWLSDVARGLAAAHKAGLVHRDVKPANIMISDEDVVKVLDFGLAKVIEASSVRTEVGIVVGTPRYLAPEIFTGVKADARSDQYAFGVTAYELLGGEHPGGPTGGVPAALDTIVPGLRANVARIVARTLSRVPGDRFASMDEVASALEEELHESRVGLPGSAPETRREGVVPHAPIAVAPTELVRAAHVRPESVRPAPDSGPPRALLGPTPTKRLSADLAPRRSSAPIVVLVLLLLGGGGYGAYLALDRGSATVAPAPSASASTTIELEDAEVAAPPALETAIASEDDHDAMVAQAPDAEADGSLPSTWTGVVDDFEDPWLKRPNAVKDASR